MTDKLESFWPTSSWPSDGWLGLVATWSFPLSQSDLSPETVADLEQELLQEIQFAVSEGTQEGFRVNGVPASRYEINQIGSAAETFHGMFAWLQELPAGILTALLAERSARGFAVIAGYVKGRVQSFRRDVNGNEITANLRFHPEFLRQLCFEHVIDNDGPMEVENIQWRLLNDEEQAALEPSWPPSDQFWIEISGSYRTYRFRVDEMGTVHEFWVNGLRAELSQIVPDVRPIPVPAPTYQDWQTGNVVTGWPSQDGIDRSESIAIVAILSADFGEPIEDMEFVEQAGRISDQVQSELEKAVRQAVGEVLPDSSAQGLVAAHYQVGPAASGLAGLEHYIVELFQSREVLPAIIGNLAEGWVIYEIVSRVQRQLRSWVSQFGDSRIAISTSFPPAVLSELCEQFVRMHFHPRAKLKSEWFCLTTKFYSGYVSPGHPTGAVEYLVVVSTATKAYRFRVWGDGTVSSLWMRQGKQELQLATPALFGDESNGRV